MLAQSLVSGSEPKKIRIFYSYSHNDSRYRERFDEILSTFKWDVIVEPWYDGYIKPGTYWEKSIRKNLNMADIILLFVTQSFMTSEYCWEFEVPWALKRHKQGKTRVIPIIFEDTEPDWRKSIFAKLQVLPQNGRPVNNWKDQEVAFEQITQSIINIITEQGIPHQSEKKWKLVIEGDSSKFSFEDRANIVKSLRNYTGDRTLRIVEIKKGSIAMLMKSTEDAFQKIITSFKDGTLAEILSQKIIDIFELYGAGMQAYTYSSNDGLINFPGKLPKDELMLFPTETYIAPVKGFFWFVPENLRKDERAFIFLLDQVDQAYIEKNVLKEIRKRLIDYIFTGLSVHDENLWINLSPDERNRMIPEYMSGMPMGRVLLDADYQLKRLSASLLHPDCGSGRIFWKNVFTKALERFGTNIRNCSTFLRVWIVPDKIIVREGKTLCYIEESSLKVMCEYDYLKAYSKGNEDYCRKLNELCYPIFNDIILPIINKEVNEGTTFAPLREVYNSVIISRWCKTKLGEIPEMKQFININKRIKVDENWKINLSDLNIPENKEYYDKYMDAFKNGVFYTIRDEYDMHTKCKITRVYYAGAIDFRLISDWTKSFLIIFS
jgi:hypothetical protein